MITRYEYCTEITFNGKIHVTFRTYSKKHWWSREKLCDTETVYLGMIEEKAQREILDHVRKRRGQEVKYRSFKNERGETPISDY